MTTRVIMKSTKRYTDRDRLGLSEQCKEIVSRPDTYRLHRGHGFKMHYIDGRCSRKAVKDGFCRQHLNEWQIEQMHKRWARRAAVRTMFLLVVLAVAAVANAQPMTRPVAVVPTEDTIILRQMFRTHDGGSKVIRPKGPGQAWQVNDTVTIDANWGTFIINGTVGVDWKGPPDRPLFIVNGTSYTTIGGPGYLRVNCRSDRPLLDGLVMRNRSMEDQARDRRACTENTFIRIHIAESDPGGLLRDGFRVEGGTADRRTDRNNDLHRFVECHSFGAGHAGFHIPDGNTQAYDIGLINCRFGSHGTKPEEFSPFGIKVVSGSVQIKGGGANRNLLDLFIVRNSRPMVVTDWMSEQSVRMFDMARSPNAQRIDFERCSWNSEFLAADREVFTYRKAGVGCVGVDVLFTTLVRPILRTETEGALVVHPVTNADLVTGESALPVPVEAGEMLPF